MLEKASQILPSGISVLRSHFLPHFQVGVQHIQQKLLKDLSPAC